MKLQIVYNFPLFQRLNIGGMVLYPFMLFKRSKEEVTDKLFRHELEHVYQVRRLGWFKFYFSYLWLRIKHKHGDHPYEMEANAHENDPLTEAERALKNLS